MKTALIVGAGEVGSRHLQALAAVSEPLSIHVVEPSPKAQATAQERFASFKQKAPHEILFRTDLSDLPKSLDVTIVATNADVRKNVCVELLSKAKVRYLLLEKILFADPQDYEEVDRLLKAPDAPKTWVNCCMRQMPIFQQIKDWMGFEKSFFVQASGSNYGLVTNAIHHLDFVAYLTGCQNFTLQTELLDKNILASKRKGFLELSGTLTAQFEDGTQVVMQGFPTGELPVVVEVHTPNQRILVREAERRAWISKRESKWVWTDIEAVRPFQSILTTEFVESVLSKGTSVLTPFAESVRIHRQLLDPLHEWLQGQKHSNPFHYPFT